MTNNQRSRQEDYSPPEAIVEVLRNMGTFRKPEYGQEKDTVSSSFQQKCHNAAEVVHGIMLMRKAKASTGFLRLPFEKYVKAIAEDAKVTLEPVLEWFGIRNMTDEKSRPSWRNLAKFAEELRFSCQEAGVALRHSLADQLGFALPPTEALFRTGNGQQVDPVEELDTILEQVEKDYCPKAKEKLDAVLSAVQDVYGP